MANANVLDLYTTIKNVSGASRYLGYIPPHGRTVANNGTVTVPGDIMDYLRKNRRARLAFEADLTATPPKIEITTSQKPVFTNQYVGAVVAAPGAPTVAAGSGSAGTWTGTTKLHFALTWVSPGIGETTIGTKNTTIYVPGDNSGKAPAITVPTVPTTPVGVVAHVYGSVDGATSWQRVLASKAAGAHEFTGAWPPSPVVTPPTTNTLIQAAVAAPQSAVSISGSSSGGTLAAGSYKVAVTFQTIWGETSVGSSLSTGYTATGATSSIAVTAPTVPAYPAETTVNVYVTDTTGLAATLRRVTTGVASAGSYTITSLPTLSASNPAPPTTNTPAQPKAAQTIGTKADGTLILVDPSWSQ